MSLKFLLRSTPTLKSEVYLETGLILQKTMVDVFLLVSHFTLVNLAYLKSKKYQTPKMFPKTQYFSTHSYWFFTINEVNQ